MRPRPAHAKRQRPARIGLDRGAVLGEGDDRATAEQRHQAHAVEAGMGGLGTDTEEGQGFPAKALSRWAIRLSIIVFPTK